VNNKNKRKSIGKIENRGKNREIHDHWKRRKDKPTKRGREKEREKERKDKGQ
jgi:hypothetical protein